MPEPTDQTLAARIDLSPAGASMLSPLHAAIPARHPNRAAYADRPVASELLTAMEVPKSKLVPISRERRLRGEVRDSH